MKSERIISVHGLDITAQVGVSDEERKSLQRLLLDLRFTAAYQPADLNDDISLTIDYHTLSVRAAEISRERPRRLIETLADELAGALLNEFKLRWIEITVRKFILPQTEWVSVTTRRDRG